MTISDTATRIRESIGRVIVGKDEVIDLVLVALLAEGHILMEDVPGIGKTTLAKALARSLGLAFRRIQFTPDILPTDVTGLSFYNQKSGDFEFRPGPINAQIILADEINRATPRTQSALLEAMEERQVTVDGETRLLPRPFLVIATQNPVELEGTFPLPEAQLDRFLLRLKLGYPSEDEENTILMRFEQAAPLEDLTPVVDADELIQMQSQIRRIHVADAVRGYMVKVVRATRTNQAVSLGASPRASLALYKSAQALAALRGREFVTPDDIKALAVPVLTHRLILSPQARLRGRSPEAILEEIVAGVPVPVEEGV